MQATGEFIEDDREVPVRMRLPRDFGSDAEFMKELMINGLKARIAGLLMVYSIHVQLYEDWLQPLRMNALPLSIGGAFLLSFDPGICMRRAPEGWAPRRMR